MVDAACSDTSFGLGGRTRSRVELQGQRDRARGERAGRATDWDGPSLRPPFSRSSLAHVRKVLVSSWSAPSYPRVQRIMPSALLPRPASLPALLSAPQSRAQSHAQSHAQSLFLTSRTAGSTHGRPASSRYAPITRSTLRAAGSALNALERPKMASGASSGTAPKSDAPPPPAAPPAPPAPAPMEEVVRASCSTRARARSAAIVSRHFAFSPSCVW